MTDTTLLTPEQKRLLLSYLDAHIKDSRFDDQIEAKLDSLNLNSKSNIEEIYEEIYNFMTNNMPQNVQDAFFEDIKRFVTFKK